LIVLLLANKSDLVTIDHNAPASQTSTTFADSLRWISAIAAQSDEALVRPLMTGLLEGLRGDYILDEAAPIVTSRRHRDHLERALTAVGKATEAWESSASGDILSLELRAAMFELGAITGATTNEDILGHIFSKFCIGK